ncbi:MAG TPA: rhodanese-like domain-containing protein [Vicinamibacterales bacterium]|nr:rhodanese-like domain-containing protein [Vicinamibacterales bacterium]
MFQRFFDEGLAQASFLIGCGRTRQAVVIDPRRDAAIYTAAAAQHGAAIVAAIETHVHADFVSGARELAASGARVITGPSSGVRYPHQQAGDGETLAVGDVTLTFLHTPGHTPEHICILAAAPGQPARLFTGDLLFVGAVGRPDLLGDEQTARLARDLFTSLQRVMQLDDDVEVHPGHGAGSLCGAGIGKEPSSTIGRERRQNALLHHTDRDAFVEAVLGDIPPTPPYFARMKRVNAEGAALLSSVRGAGTLPAIAPAAVAALVADGAVLIDLRSAGEFGTAHPEGALNIGFGPKIGYWAGWVVPPDVPIVLLADDPAQAPEAALQLLRIGLDRVEGTLAGGFDAWSRAGLPVAAIDQVSAAELRDAVGRREPMQLIDVRTPREYTAGHVDGAINVPVGEILSRSGELRRDAPTAVMCEGGFRSALAASLLQREGFTHLANVAGGMAAFREAVTR